MNVRNSATKANPSIHPRTERKEEEEKKRKKEKEKVVVGVRSFPDDLAHPNGRKATSHYLSILPKSKGHMNAVPLAVDKVTSQTSETVSNWILTPKLINLV